MTLQRDKHTIVNVDEEEQVHYSVYISKLYIWQS
jgi:hypothetical protein